MNTATALFAEKGFEHTSLAAVCKEAEVSKGLIFHHFKSKNDLLRQIFSRTTEVMIDLSTTDNASTDAKSELLSLIDRFFKQLSEDKSFFQLNLNIMLQPATRDVLEDLIEERSSFLLSTATQLFQKLFPSDFESKAYLFIAELDGIALNYLCIFKHYPLETIKAELLTKYKSL